MTKERQLRRRLREKGYYLKVSPAQTKGTAVNIGEDHGLYQITNGDNVVAGWWYNLTLRDVEEWISERERDDEWLMYGGGDDE